MKKLNNYLFIFILFLKNHFLKNFLRLSLDLSLANNISSIKLYNGGQLIDLLIKSKFDFSISFHPQDIKRGYKDLFNVSL